MRGGGIGATLFEFIPLGLGIANSAAPIATPLALICAMLAEPPVRANDAAGKAKTTKAKAIFIAVFDIANLHQFTGTPKRMEFM
jgi:ssDNA-specific exonuclease RecJ